MSKCPFLSVLALELGQHNITVNLLAVCSIQLPRQFKDISFIMQTLCCRTQLVRCILWSSFISYRAQPSPPWLSSAVSMVGICRRCKKLYKHYYCVQKSVTEVHWQISDWTPLPKNAATSQDIALVVGMLASKESDFMTGERSHLTR